MFGRNLSWLDPAGFSVDTGPYGEITVQYIFQCCHCQKCWYADQKSLGGKESGGYCGKCVGFICRDEFCLTNCRPAEHRIENLEAGRPEQELPPQKILVPELYRGK